jgi:hypothetical protein
MDLCNSVKKEINQLLAFRWKGYSYSRKRHYDTYILQTLWILFSLFSYSKKMKARPCNLYADFVSTIPPINS